MRYKRDEEEEYLLTAEDEYQPDEPGPLATKQWTSAGLVLTLLGAIGIIMPMLGFQLRQLRLLPPTWQIKIGLCCCLSGLTMLAMGRVPGRHRGNVGPLSALVGLAGIGVMTVAVIFWQPVPLVAPAGPRVVRPKPAPAPAPPAVPKLPQFSLSLDTHFFGTGVGEFTTPDQPAEHRTVNLLITGLNDRQFAAIEEFIDTRIKPNNRTMFRIGSGTRFAVGPVDDFQGLVDALSQLGFLELKSVEEQTRAAEFVALRIALTPPSPPPIVVPVTDTTVDGYQLTSRTFVDGKLSLLIPAELTELSETAASRQYFGLHDNLYVFSDSKKTFEIFIHHTERRPFRESQLQEFLEYRKKKFRTEITKHNFTKTELRTIGEQLWAVWEFDSYHGDFKVRNIVLLTVDDSGVAQVGIRVLDQDWNHWQAVAQSSIDSLRLQK